VEEIAFVGMKPFYGLRLYLDKTIEGVLITEPGLEHSKFLAAESLCDELAERERNIFVVKRSRSEPFLTAVARCSGLGAIEVGGFFADDNELAIYSIRR
jgi:hypothetical protein